jgi:hypothetical protein
VEKFFNNTMSKTPQELLRSKNPHKSAPNTLGMVNGLMEVLRSQG